MKALTNCQLIFLADLKRDIEGMKGKPLTEIIEALNTKYADDYWCVTRQDEIDQCLNVAIYTYAMTEEEKVAFDKLNELLKSE